MRIVGPLVVLLLLAGMTVVRLVASNYRRGWRAGMRLGTAIRQAGLRGFEDEGIVDWERVLDRKGERWCAGCREGFGAALRGTPLNPERRQLRQKGAYRNGYRHGYSFTEALALCDQLVCVQEKGEYPAEAGWHGYGDAVSLWSSGFRDGWNRGGYDRGALLAPLGFEPPLPGKRADPPSKRLPDLASN